MKTRADHRWVRYMAHSLILEEGSGCVQLRQRPVAVPHRGRPTGKEIPRRGFSSSWRVCR
ncbi:MAG: hypothetical protein ACREQ1_14685 [Woeseiaceae bacterium]